MRPSRLLGLAALAGAAVAGYATRRIFRHDMADISAALDRVSQRAPTDHGLVEYGREGDGAPALVIHGAGGGFDQGLLVGRELLGPGHEIIAPSRFGYLRTGVPDSPGHVAQAAAHAQLLDSLGIRKAVVLGISAGSPSAIELALGNPERVSALILAVPRAYAPGVEVSAERTAANRPIMDMIMRGADFPYWLATRFAALRRGLLRFLGVPTAVYDAADPLERERLDAVARSIMPLSRRVAGLRVDAGQSVTPWPLEQMKVPTLVISAEDDLYNTLPAACWTAEHVEGAELFVLPSGGHLMCGQTEAVRGRIADFLRRHAQPAGKAA